jgi:hypothetical protein
VVSDPSLEKEKAMEGAPDEGEQADEDSRFAVSHPASGDMINFESEDPPDFARASPEHPLSDVYDDLCPSDCCCEDMLIVGRPSTRFGFDLIGPAKCTAFYEYSLLAVE